MDANLKNAIEVCFKSYVQPKSFNDKKKSFPAILNSLKEEGFVHHFPYQIFLEITSECNLRCKHCFYYNNQNKFDSKDDLSIEKILNLAKFFVEEAQVIEFTLTGGEPFLNKNILKLIKYLKSKNIYISIITNGTLITPQMAKELGKMLNPKNDIVHVSLEGISSEVNDKTRGKSSFDKVNAGLKNLIDAGIRVSVTYTVTSLNIEELPELYDFCKNLKVNQVSLNKYKNSSEEQSYLIPETEKVFLNTAKLLENIGNDNSFNINMLHINIFEFLQTDYGKKLLDNYINEQKPALQKDLMCHNHGKIMISAAGKVYLCAATEKDELCLGDLNYQSFNEIWGNRFNNVFFQPRLAENSFCKTCKYLNLCLGGCPASAYESFKNINAPDANCPIFQKSIKIYKEIYSAK